MAARMYCARSALPVTHFLLPLIVTGWVTGTQDPLLRVCILDLEYET
jgi:hypothetical protein